MEINLFLEFCFNLFRFGFFSEVFVGIDLVLEFRSISFH